MGCADLIDALPIDDVFVTGLGEIEGLGNGLIRVYLTSLERGTHVIKARLVMPVNCALQMNDAAREILVAEHRKAYPLRIV